MFITIHKLSNNSRYTLIFPYQIKDHAETRQDFWRNGITSWPHKLFLSGPDTFSAGAKLHSFLGSIPEVLYSKIDQIDIAWERSDRMDIRISQALTRPEEASLWRSLSDSFCLPLRHL